MDDQKKCEDCKHEAVDMFDEPCINCVEVIDYALVSKWEAKE